MSMKKIIALVVLFLFAFVVFAIALFPASVALHFVKGHLPAQLQFGSANGTVWEGQISGVKYKQHYVSKLSWDLSPWALFTGQARSHVVLGDQRTPDEAYAKGDVEYGLFSKQLTLSDARVRVALEQVLDEFALPLPTQARGRVFVDITDYQQGLPHCQALAGNMSSADIRVKGTKGWFSIGELSADLGCKNGALELKVTEENRLGLQIDASINERNQLSADGFIKPDASLPKDVHDAVQFLGQQTSDGRYRIQF